MLISMTGFGKASRPYANKVINAEIRSLNSKQLDLSVKLPSAYRDRELEVRNGLVETLGRGKVDLYVFFESQEGEKKVSINQPLALSYLAEIQSLSKAAGLDSDRDVLATVLAMPDVLQSDKVDADPEEWSEIGRAISDAAAALVSFRTEEGERLDRDITERVKSIDAKRKETEGFLDDRMNSIRERIAKNIDEFLREGQGDRNRMEQEIVYYLEKLDITEEHVRLAGHCTYFLETMKAEGMVGKKLGFISQEMGREINTLGAKANHVEIQKLVVEMKDELEKIKEQLLNIL